MRAECKLCFVLPCRNNRATSLTTSHIEFDRVHQNKGRTVVFVQNKTRAGDLGSSRVLIHTKTAFGRRMDAQPRRQRWRYGTTKGTSIDDVQILGVIFAPHPLLPF